MLIAYDEMWKEGFRLSRLQAFALDGQVRYNAIFQPSTVGQFASFGKSLSAFKQQYLETMAKGFRLISLDAC